MWVARLKIWHEDCIIIHRAKKFNVVVMTYPIGEFRKGGRIYFTSVNTIQGREEDKEAFIKDLSEDKRVDKIERNGDMFFILNSRDPKTKHLRGYRESQVFFVKPVVQKGGFEYWEIASWGKEGVVDFYNYAKENRQTELMKMKQEKLTDLYVPNIMKHLTEKQKQAIETAYKAGYYEYPKRTDLRKLAKMAGISLTTFQEHLKKAENKLISAQIENIAE